MAADAAQATQAIARFGDDADHLDEVGAEQGAGRAGVHEHVLDLDRRSPVSHSQRDEGELSAK